MDLESTCSGDSEGVDHSRDFENHWSEHLLPPLDPRILKWSKLRPSLATQWYEMTWLFSVSCVSRCEACLPCLLLLLLMPVETLSFLVLGVLSVHAIAVEGHSLPQPVVPTGLFPSPVSGN